MAELPFMELVAERTRPELSVDDIDERVSASDSDGECVASASTPFLAPRDAIKTTPRSRTSSLLDENAHANDDVAAHAVYGETMEPGDGNTLDHVSSDSDRAKLAHRGRVVREVVQSERVYHGLLLDFLQCYGAALQAELEEASSDFMSRASLVGLQSNLEQLANVSALLMSDLTRCVPSCKSALAENTEQALMADARAPIGEVFLQSSSLLKLYGQYAENHAGARRDIRATTSSPVFTSFWDRTETEAMLGRGPGSEPPRAPSTSATLDGYLILPIQRVPRYLLLLRELVKCTPSAWVQETASLDRASVEVEAAARFMNQCIWRAEQTEVLRDLQSRFVGTTVDFIGGVGPAGYRALLLEGELVRITRKGAHRILVFHLLNDAVCYSRQVNGGFKFHRALPLDGTCRVVDVPAPASPSVYDTYTSVSVDPSLGSASHRVLTRSASTIVDTVDRLRRGLASLNGTTQELENGPNPTACGSGGAENGATPVASRAFRLETPHKSFVVYAATPELKRKWVDAIEGAIREAAVWMGENTTAAPSATSASATSSGSHRLSQTAAALGAAVMNSGSGVAGGKADACEMCRTPLHLFKRRVRCERCNLLVCGVCGSNSRVLQVNSQSRHQALKSVCCACAWELDGTALDTDVDEFRLKLWVDDVQSLVGHRRGHSFLDPKSSLAGGKKHPDAEEALKRLYFSVTFRRQRRLRALSLEAPHHQQQSLASEDEDALLMEEEIRGPCNAGVMGPDGAFSFPIGLPSDAGLAHVTLRVFVVGHAGEMGHVTVKPADVIAEQAVARNQPFSKWFVAQTHKENQTAVSTLAVTLVQPRHREAIHRDLSAKERSALRLGVKIAFELHVPPALWGFHFASDGRRRPTSVTSRASAVKAVESLLATSGGGDDSPRESDDVAARLRRFMAIDDAANGVGGTAYRTLATAHRGGETVQHEDVESFNPSLLSDYERRVFQHPSVWGVCLTDILYSDCMARFGAKAKVDATRYADTQLTILNRFHAFHGRFEVAKLVAAQSAVVGVSTAAPTGSSAVQERRPSKNSLISSDALRRLAHSAAGGGELSGIKEHAKDGGEVNAKEDEEDEDEEDEDDRGAIFKELLSTEQDYARWMEVLDHVFVSRLLQVIQGANVLLQVSKDKDDAWVDKMGLKSQPVMTTGVTTSSSSWSPTRLVQRAKRPQLLKASPSSNGGDGAMGSSSESAASGYGHDDGAGGVLGRPGTVTLLQSVRQIRTVNEEFLASLQDALDAAGCAASGTKRGWSQAAKLGGIVERFCGVLSSVYSSYATNQVTVLDDLCANSGLPPSLRALLDACEADPRCKGTDLRSLLNLPLERLDTYRSMLSALLVCTPRTHSDWEHFRVALGKIVESTKHMTRVQRRKENVERLREIEKDVDGLPAEFRLVENNRWLVREGTLIEKLGETHRARGFFLFSDALMVVGKRGGGGGGTVQRLAARFSGGGGDRAEAGKKFAFKKLIRISDLTVCDLPRGCSGSRGQVLGDASHAFCIASVATPSFVVLVPNNPTECVTRVGPAPVEFARIAPPPAHCIETRESRGRQAVVYEKSQVKSAWMDDLLLCIEMHQRSAVFDDDEGVVAARARPGSVRMRGATMGSSVAALPERATVSFAHNFAASDNPTFCGGGGGEEAQHDSPSPGSEDARASHIDDAARTPSPVVVMPKSPGKRATIRPTRLDSVDGGMTHQ